MTSALNWFLHHAAAASLLAAPLCLCACSGEIECKSELTTGSASYTGVAVGKAETDALRRTSLRDACLQKCGAEHANMIDPCAAACVTDVDAKKLGAKTTCGRK